MYYHLEFDLSEVDWVGAGLDTGGIIADYVPGGQGVGIGLDLISVSEISGPQFGRAIESGDSLQIIDAGIDLALDAGGLIPVFGNVPDVLSLGKNFAQNTHIYYGP